MSRAIFSKDAAYLMIRLHIVLSETQACAPIPAGYESPRADQSSFP